MADLRFKRCTRCGRLKPEGRGGGMCAECEAAYAAERAEERAAGRDWAKEYRERRDDPEARRFYRSKEWRMVSLSYAQKMGHACEECGRVGTDVHHVAPIDTPEGWARRFDESNLRLLCVRCHNKAHGRSFGNGWGGA